MEASAGRFGVISAASASPEGTYPYECLPELGRPPTRNRIKTINNNRPIVTYFRLDQN